MNAKYRIVEKTCKLTGEAVQAIHEVFYKRGEPYYIIKTPAEIQWNLGTSTHLVLKEIQEAFDKPILQYDDFVDSLPF